MGLPLPLPPENMDNQSTYVSSPDAKVYCYLLGIAMTDHEKINTEALIKEEILNTMPQIIKEISTVSPFNIALGNNLLYTSI